MMNHANKLIQHLSVFAPVLGGISLPLLKVSTIALTHKLLQEILRLSFPGLVEEINATVFATIRSSGVTRYYLLENLTFHENLMVCGALALVVSIALPLRKTLENYVGFMEIKRLQKILFQNFVVNSNTMDTKEANDLLFTKIASIEKYWVVAKYRDIMSATTLVFSSMIFMILAWDLGMIAIGKSSVAVSTWSF